MYDKTIQIAQIVAISRNYTIGKDNQLPWHLPADLQHFKNLTQGGIVIMGRKTFESIGKPLPNRISIVITQNVDYQADFDNVYIVHGLDSAIELGKGLAGEKGLDTLWVIGGEQIFRQALPITERLEVTHIAVDVVDADAFFPQFLDSFVKSSDNLPQTDEKSGLVYEFVSYVRSSRDWWNLFPNTKNTNQARLVFFDTIIPK